MNSVVAYKTIDWRDIENSQVVFIHPGKYIDMFDKEWKKSEIVGLLHSESVGAIVMDLNPLTTTILIPDSTPSQITAIKRNYKNRNVFIVQFHSVLKMYRFNYSSSLPLTKYKDMVAKRNKKGRFWEKRKSDISSKGWEEDDEDVQKYAAYGLEEREKENAVASRKNKLKVGSKKKRSGLKKKKIVKKTSNKTKTRKLRKKLTRKKKSSNNKKRPSKKLSSNNKRSSKKRSSNNRKRSSKKRKISPAFKYWGKLVREYAANNGGGFPNIKKGTAGYREIRRKYEKKYPS